MDNHDLDSTFHPLSVDVSPNSLNEENVDDINDEIKSQCSQVTAQTSDNGLNIPDTGVENVLDMLISPDSTSFKLSKADEKDDEHSDDVQDSFVQTQSISSVIGTEALLHGNMDHVELVTIEPELGDSSADIVALKHSDRLCLLDDKSGYAVSIGRDMPYGNSTTLQLIPDESTFALAQICQTSSRRRILPNNTRQYICSMEHCGKNFTTQHQLKVHLRSHTNERPFKCTYQTCGKSFTSHYGLKSHIRVHTGEKPYRCNHGDCTKGFKTSGDLQKHIRVHTGERPFKCPFENCNRAFTTSNIRKVHIRTHTGERPYACEHIGCGRTFASATNYKNHIRIHSGEKPYVCSHPECGKSFTEYSSLYKHQVVHTHTKPYECDICHKNYRQTSTLALHRRTVHSIVHDCTKDTKTHEKRIITADGPAEPINNPLFVDTAASHNLVMKTHEDDKIMSIPTHGVLQVHGTEQYIILTDQTQVEAFQNLAKNGELVDLKTVTLNNVLALSSLQVMPVCKDSEEGVDASTMDTTTPPDSQT